jgi:hypothetical protein
METDILLKVDNVLDEFKDMVTSFSEEEFNEVPF